MKQIIIINYGSYLIMYRIIGIASGILTCSLVVLKLTGVISWGWHLVTMPTWSGFVLFGLGTLLLVLSGGYRE